MRKLIYAIEDAVGSFDWRTDMPVSLRPGCTRAMSQNRHVLVVSLAVCLSELADLEFNITFGEATGNDLDLAGNVFDLLLDGKVPECVKAQADLTTNLSSAYTNIVEVEDGCNKLLAAKLKDVNLAISNVFATSISPSVRLGWVQEALDKLQVAQSITAVGDTDDESGEDAESLPAREVRRLLSFFE